MILKMINLNRSKEGELQVINCVIHCRITESLLEFKRASLEAYISQEQLTLLTAIDRSYLWRIERGEVNITVENSIKYLKC